ncbi:hypothetical protein [Vibrio aerogenes]|uniref:hypothetical protein n=1 Tax=Vibrio aerogenes TaxID=92172 RepID=UPI0021C3B6E4|nr:hypothetical protein [Vibrio aerogenes]
MKLKALLLLSILLGGCASSPPPAPEPKGKVTPVNPKVVYLNQLYTRPEAGQ